ncbi:Type IV secretory pathway, VirB4 components [[Eubacterium] infirmum]|nr:Type IV secretory pathway, VirB4 components [[Eubacterium] infirmum]
MESSKGKVLGVIVGVEGDEAEVAMYTMSNDTTFLWDGDILIGTKIGALLTIYQNDIKIIASVSKEKIVDVKNNVKSVEFDNRYSKDSINRCILLKVKGIIDNNQFSVTSKYVPMIGNEVAITNREDLDVIYGLKSNEYCINIGKSILEDKPIKISINKFFASHIGIFGNTGSGKSNTLHKLFFELFKTDCNDCITNKSKFFVIDFNGEYSSEDIFGVDEKKRKTYKINTRIKMDEDDKLPVVQEYLFNPDVLALLFDARPATQVPFLRVAINKYNTQIKDKSDFARIEIGLLIKILETFKSCGIEAVNNWINACESTSIDSKFLIGLKNFENELKYGNAELRDSHGNLLISNNRLTDEGKAYFQIDNLNRELEDFYLNSNPLMRLKSFLEFQKVYVTSWKSTNIEHLNPLFKRIDSAFSSLDKVIGVIEKPTDEFKLLNIISLINANSEITRLIPMLLSKMIYDQHKYDFNHNDRKKTVHLIIDEAHNILNDSVKNVGDDWQDYRLSIFEEIIKEGRKFGFFVTIASQRPADISQTITSQLHNFFIHRLVNEKDLRMLENTMPTLDKGSYKKIPTLGKGEAIVTGNALSIPLFIKVDKEETVRPNSDDIILTDIWNFDMKKTENTV